MKTLKLEKGDKVVIAKTVRGKIVTSTLTVASLKNSNKNNDFYVIIGTNLHTYLENLGILSSKSHKKKTLKIFPTLTQQKLYSSIELLEVQKAPKWYTSILNKFRFFRNKQK